MIVLYIHTYLPTYMLYLPRVQPGVNLVITCTHSYMNEIVPAFNSFPKRSVVQKLIAHVGSIPGNMKVYICTVCGMKNNVLCS